MTSERGHREIIETILPASRTCALSCTSFCGSETRQPSPASGGDTAKDRSGIPSPAPAAGSQWRLFSLSSWQAFLSLTDPAPHRKAEEKSIQSVTCLTNLPCWSTSSAGKALNPQPISLRQSRALSSSRTCSQAWNTLQHLVSTMSCAQGKLPPKETVWGKHLTPLRLHDRPH